MEHKPVPSEVIEKFTKIKRKYKGKEYLIQCDVGYMNERERKRFEENSPPEVLKWKQRLVNRIFLVDKKHICSGNRMNMFEFKTDVKSWEEYQGNYHIYECSCGNILVINIR